MKSHTEAQATIRQYLLGVLPQDDLPELEERLLIDGSFYEELLITEDELVDQYLKDELSQPEREAFESHFLRTPERQQKLRFARALRKLVDAEEEAPADSPVRESTAAAWVPTHVAPKRRPFSFIQNPALGFALAAIILVVVIGTSWLVLRNWRSVQPAPQDVLTQVLTPGQTRGTDGDTKEFAIPADKGTVRLQLALAANEYQTYRVVLQNVDGTVILSKDALKPLLVNSRATLVLDVASRSLPPGDYQVKLSGIPADGNPESLNGYFFRVRR